MAILEYDLPLKDLSEKLVILLCLLSGQREQIVEALNIKDMLLEKVNMHSLSWGQWKPQNQVFISLVLCSQKAFQIGKSAISICDYNHPLFRNYKRLTNHWSNDY